MKLRLPFIFSLLCGSFLNVFPQSETVNQKVLDKILQRAKETHSSSVLIIKDGKIIGEYYEGGKNEKIDLMSSTKSIVSLAIGKLIDLSKIKSVDQPVYEFYPEWKQGRKGFVTIKHLLNHTSGMQNVSNAGIEVERSKDSVKLALAAELSDEPGARFSYNNKAVNLLTGIVEVASGKRMDVFFRDEFFYQMGIKDFGWRLDPAGNPYAYAGLQLSAIDFAKFGTLVLDHGKWDGKQIVSEKWIAESFAQSQPFDESYGLLWGRTSSEETYTIDDVHLDTLAKAGVEKSFLDALQPIKGKIYKAGERVTAVSEIFGKDWQKIVTAQIASKNTVLFKKRIGEVDGYHATGSLGQFLMVVPKGKVVAVRQVKAGANYNPATDGFEDFKALVMQLIK
jgi:CubicO group peptidase (beta-lactamase class C family)